MLLYQQIVVLQWRTGVVSVLREEVALETGRLGGVVAAVGTRQGPLLGVLGRDVESHGFTVDRLEAAQTALEVLVLPHDVDLEGGHLNGPVVAVRTGERLLRRMLGHDVPLEVSRRAALVRTVRAGEGPLAAVLGEDVRLEVGRADGLVVAEVARQRPVSRVLGHHVVLEVGRLGRLEVAVGAGQVLLARVNGHVLLEVSCSHRPVLALGARERLDLGVLGHDVLL